MPDAESLCVAVTGSSGLVGTRLCAMLEQRRHRVLPVRRAAGAGHHASWDVAGGRLDFPQTPDVLVHLAGRTVATRWTARAMRQIRESRVDSTERLCTFLASLPADKRPRRIIAASAIGIYGSRGDEVLTEDSPAAPPGGSFLGDVGLHWEAATNAARQAGIAVSLVRIGVVLSRTGGALAKMVTPVKLGLGGPIGPGTQFMPWISLHDLSRLLITLVQCPSPPPIVNAVGPAPVRQHEFIRTLGRVLGRPTVFPMPTFMVKLLFGQMGVEVLLSSLRVIATRLPEGFVFEHPTLEAAIRGELERPSSPG